MNCITYRFDKHFSKYPGGRKIDHGPASGELFLIELVKLRKLAREHDMKVLIDLRDVGGMTLGFLDESFGQLALVYGMEVLEIFKFDVEEECKFLMGDIINVCRRAVDTQSKYPVHDKVQSVKAQSNVIGEFLEWIDEQEDMYLAEEDGPPVMASWETILYRYFEIDRDALMQEKDLMLAAQRELNDLLDLEKKPWHNGAPEVPEAVKR